MTTHETFIHAVRDTALRLACLPADQSARLSHAKLVYGRGEAGLRGVTAFGAWQNGTPEPTELIEICAAAEENWIQLAGTTIHELGHALAGWKAGHSQDWKDSCERLGLRVAKAAGMVYQLGYFAPPVRMALAALPHPKDGSPCLDHRHRGRGVRLPTFAARPCGAGIGTRGGKSRGPGSGSRLRKFICSCAPPVIVRVGRDEFHAHCDLCGDLFNRA